MRENPQVVITPWVCPPTPSLPPHLCPLPALICHAPLAPPLSQNAPCTNPESDLYFMDELFVSWPYYPPSSLANLTDIFPTI